jgi:hypothetical protein
MPIAQIAKSRAMTGRLSMRKIIRDIIAAFFA